MQGRGERDVSRSSSIERDYSIKSKVSKVDRSKKIDYTRRRSRSTEVRHRRRDDDPRDYDRKRDDESRNYDSRKEDRDRKRKRSRSEDRHRRERVRSLSVENKMRRNDHKEIRDRYDRETDKTKEKSSDVENDKNNDNEMNDYWASKKQKTSLKSVLNDNVLTKTGGAYIPPARLRMMQDKINDKNSAQYQRIAWEALKKSIHGLINKVTASNITEICNELFQENIVRGRGLLVKSIILAQSLSLTFTHVFAALIAVVNSKFPQVGVLLLNRLVLQFKRGFKRNIKSLCISSTRFIAHLYNQKVVDEILPFEVLILLLERPTNDSVEVAIGILKECGRKLTDDSASATMSIFDSLKNILHEASIDKRVTYMIEVMFAIRKDGYKDFPTVLPDLEMIEDDDQFMHRVTLEDEITSEDRLNVFEFDPEFADNEKKYEMIKNELFGGGGDDDDGDDEDDSGDEEAEDGGEQTEEGGSKEVIIDKTETNLIALRRTIYLTIQSSLDYEECAHKLLKMQLKPGQEYELCNMIMDCSAQERTYIAFYGLLAQRFCNIDNKYVEPFERIFKEQYETAHRLETNKLRNVSKFFAHLLHSDAVSWEVLQCIKLNEDDTTSSSRIFIKILFQELSEYMGLAKLNQRLKDATLQTSFQEIFPKGNPRDTRFAINFFTSIGLGGLTDELRDHLKVAAATQRAAPRMRTMSSSSSSSSASSSS